MNVLCTCLFCGTQHTIVVNQDDYNRWMKGEYAQDCFPYLTADERELLISGICGPCFDKSFAEDK